MLLNYFEEAQKIVKKEKPKQLILGQQKQTSTCG
jgi:hypothetical protein